MSELIVSPTLAMLLTAFTSCVQARSYLTFQWLSSAGYSARGAARERAKLGAVGSEHTRAALPRDALGVTGLLRIDGQGVAGRPARRRGRQRDDGTTHHARGR